MTNLYIVLPNIKHVPNFYKSFPFKEYICIFLGKIHRYSAMPVRLLHFQYFASKSCFNDHKKLIFCLRKFNNNIHLMCDMQLCMCVYGYTANHKNNILENEFLKFADVLCFLWLALSDLG